MSWLAEDHTIKAREIADAAISVTFFAVVIGTFIAAMVELSKVDSAGESQVSRRILMWLFLAVLAIGLLAKAKAKLLR